MTRRVQISTEEGWYDIDWPEIKAGDTIRIYDDGDELIEYQSATVFVTTSDSYKVMDIWMVDIE